MRELLVVVAAMAWFGWSTAALAGEKADQDTVRMETVVVTASREKDEQVSVPAHVTVIDAARIQAANAQNIPELLQENGIHVSDIAGNKRNYSVDLRGFGESAPTNTLVLIDGRRVNNPDLSAADWLLIPLERIERIEIIRGGRGGVLYGDNAGGGVINIITREADGNQGGAQISYGSYSTCKGAASGSVVGDYWSMALTGAYYDSDGYRENGGGEGKDFGFDARLDPRDAVRLKISGGYHKDSTRLPGALYHSELSKGFDRTDTKTPDDFADTEDYYLSAGMEIDMLSNDTFKLEVTTRERSFDTYAMFRGLGSFEAGTEIDTLGLSPQFVFRSDYGTVKNRVVLGYDFSQTEEDIANLSDAFGIRQFFAFDKTSQAYFFHDELQVADGVTLSGGYRNERTQYRFKPGAPDETLMKHDVFNAAVNYVFAKGSHTYLSYAQSYRFPLIDELFSFYDNTIKTDFKPQQSEHFELGFHYQATERLHFLFSFFNIKTKNEIFFNKLTFENTNLDGDTIRKGVEIGARWRDRRVTAGLNYGLTTAEIDGGEFDGKTIPDAPQHQMSGDVAYDFVFGLRLGLTGQYIGERYFISDFDNRLAQQTDYFVLNAKVHYDWRSFAFFLDLNNVLDHEYAAYGVRTGSSDRPERAYYPSSGFNWLMGVKATF